MDTTTLQFLWYAVFIMCILAYAAFDGFDIGVGCLHLFAKSDMDRRICINAIGPVWDSNSLWIIITTGVLMAGFPAAFGVLFSALYMPMTLLIFGYIYRSVAIEFRSKIVSRRWRGFWDMMFALSSYCLAFGFGVVIANLIHGLPIDDHGTFIKSLKTLLSSYAILLGCFTTALFMLHGALYLHLKTEGMLQQRMKRWCWRLFIIFGLLWLAVNIVTPSYAAQVTARVEHTPLFALFSFLSILAAGGLFWSLCKNRDGWAFVSSILIILSLVLFYALGTYPNLVRSSINEAYSMTIYNASSTPFTLKILLVIAAAGVPLIFLYMIYSYRVFRGKVEIDTMSY
ncbi:MAG: cytochrome d ubiquinol oxidase subunit II [Verrucomicrobia bacterium]|nr:cytochrome d ubiquinol oxidase subunit II [Verrucomicrobiota bacterium]